MNDYIKKSVNRHIEILATRPRNEFVPHLGGGKKAPEACFFGILMRNG